MVDRKSFEILPGKTAALKLSIDLTSRRNDAATSYSSERPFPVGLIVVCANAAHSEVRFNVHGIVKDAFYATPAAVHFANVWEESENLPTVRVIVRPVLPFKKLDVGFDEEFLKAKITEDSPPATSAAPTGGQTSYSILLTLAKPLAVGNHKLFIDLKGVLATGEKMPPLRLPVAVTMVGDVFVVPNFTHLGPIRIGDDGVFHLQLVARSGSRFRVTRVESNSAEMLGATVDWERLDCMHPLRMAFRAARLGEQVLPVTIAWERLEPLAEARETNESALINLEIRYVGLESVVAK